MDWCLKRVRQLSSSKGYLLALESPYAPTHSQTLRCLRNGSNVRLIDDGPVFSPPGRSSSAFSFHASLLQAIDGAISLALCSQVVSRAPQHFRSSETHASGNGCFCHPSSLPKCEHVAFPF